MRSLTYVELVVPYCANTYGTAPCTASIPTTGAYKCFNTKKTCQDRPHYVDAPVTLRFGVDVDYLPQDIECIPVIVGVDYQGQVLSLGQDLGQRASVTITFQDVPHSDTGAGFDKYLADRSYNPYLQGSLWGKFRARQPYLRGQTLRLIRGFLGQALAAMETRSFVVESFSGPNEDGTYTLVAKDPLKLADDDRAQCPVMSNGYLLADITAAATSASLGPTGIGNSEYPASGWLAIGGKEVVSFTRSGDALTIVRATLNTTAVAHKAEDRVQLVKRYTAQDAASILYDLLVTYADVPAAYISLTSWQAEVNAYLQRNYSAYIAEPTGVNTLIAELIEQAALTLWWDDLAGQLRLQVLRSISTTADTFNDDNIVDGSMSIQDQPETRVSQVWMYFGQRNPLEPIDRKDNFRSTLLQGDFTTESDYGSAAIAEIYSRWIPDLGRTIATRATDIKLARFKNPPRRFTFDLWRPNISSIPASLGGGYKVGTRVLQDDTGAAALIPVQITHLRPGPERLICEAEEMSFTGVTLDDPNLHVVTIDLNVDNVNLRTLHDSLFATAVSGVTVRCIISTGVRIGASAADWVAGGGAFLPYTVYAFDVGSWASGVIVEIINNGRIQGFGGSGGELAPDSLLDPTGRRRNYGGNGGVALYTRYAATVTNNGQISGGGGGGGGGDFVGSAPYYRGGGGAGRPSGFPTKAYLAANLYTLPARGSDLDTGGTVGNLIYNGSPTNVNIGANGGTPGVAGDARGSYLGGDAGPAVDGNSYITWSVAGTRLGGLIN